MNPAVLIKALLFTLLSASAAYSQVITPGDLLRDDTSLRNRYLLASQAREQAPPDNADRDEAATYRKIYEEQYKDITTFWSGSEPVTDPAINGYLQSIVDRIISANPELHALNARVVFSRDWWPNAYCMGDGTIAVNAGLFIYLKNEAELAFVVCHELAHDYLRHNEKEVRAYVQKINDVAFQQDLKRIARQGYSVNRQLEDLLKVMVFDSRRHGRDHESEADTCGLRFMMHTGYDCRAMRTCLQMLDHIDDTAFYSRAPRIDSLLDFPGYPFRPSWIRKSSAIFSDMKQDASVTPAEKDSMKTHPDCANRILLFDNTWKDDGAVRQDFLVSEQKFKEIKSRFYYEIMEQCYRQDELSRNLYYALTLLVNDPGNAYAVFSVVRCFNRIRELQKNHRLEQSIDRENAAFPVPYNLLLRMLDRMRLDELASVNTAFAAAYGSQMASYPGYAAQIAELKDTSK